MEKMITLEQRNQKMKEIISNEISSRVEMQFNREKTIKEIMKLEDELFICLLYTSPSPRDS